MVEHTQTIRRQQLTNCFSVFDHFEGLALKGLKNFDLKINKPNINTNIIDISSFRNSLNLPFSSTSFYFKGKTVKGSHEM